MDLSDYIKREHIVFVEETEKLDAIRRLVERAASISLVRDKARFEAAVRQREAMSSTGIGMGLAIPHGRCREATDFFIIPAIARYPVEWQAIDYEPVKAIFLIGIPDDQPAAAKATAGRYLGIIAALMLLVKQPDRREALFSAATPEDLIDVLTVSP